MKMVFWQNSVSIHQAPLIRSLAGRPGLSVHVVVFGKMAEHRSGMGWHAPDYGDAELIDAHADGWEAVPFERLAHADAHVVSGLGAYQFIRSAVRRIKAQGSGRVLAMTEPWDSRRLAGKIRLLRAWMRLTREGGFVDAILMCGTSARPQIRFLPWLRRTPLYDFGYFVEAEDLPGKSASDVRRGDVRMVYVGNLNEWKAPGDLIEAVGAGPTDGWTLDIYGDGPLKAGMMESIERLGISDRVRIHGVRPNREVRSEIASSDVLVLPSRYDGWGAVVVEALVQGTRVIVSDAAGARDLVVRDEIGRVYPAGDVSALAGAIESEISTTSVSRAWVAEWAERHISPSSAANYLVAIVNSVPHDVAPPWRDGLADA